MVSTNSLLLSTSPVRGQVILLGVHACSFVCCRQTHYNNCCNFLAEYSSTRYIAVDHTVSTTTSSQQRHRADDPEECLFEGRLGPLQALGHKHPQMFTSSPLSSLSISYRFSALSYSRPHRSLLCMRCLSLLVLCRP